MGEQECWLPIPGFESYYEASDWGRIRSLPRKKCRGQVIKARRLQRGGHWQVGLSVQGITYTRYVHQLVALAFHGPCPEGMEVRHDDGNPANNRPGNLIYGTHAENQHDMIRHGTTQAGTRHRLSTLTDADIAAIRSAWLQGKRGCDLASKYSISRAAVSRIVNGHAYRQGEIAPRPHETCHYPGCSRPAREGKGGSGHPHVYCDQPDHNAHAAGHERRRITLSSRTAYCAYCSGTFPFLRSSMRYCSQECRKAAKRARYSSGPSGSQAA